MFVRAEACKLATNTMTIDLALIPSTFLSSSPSVFLLLFILYIAFLRPPFSFFFLTRL